MNTPKNKTYYCNPLLTSPFDFVVLCQRSPIAVRLRRLPSKCLSYSRLCIYTYFYIYLHMYIYEFTIQGVDQWSRLKTYGLLLPKFLGSKSLWLYQLLWGQSKALL